MTKAQNARTDEDDQSALESQHSRWVARMRALVQEGLDSGPGRECAEADWIELDQIARGLRD